MAGEPPEGSFGATRAMAKQRADVRQAQPVLGRLLVLAVSSELPAKIAEWEALLAKGELTDEMVDVFVALGWLTSRQDPRLSPKVTKG